MRITSCILSFLIHCLILMFSLYPSFHGTRSFIDLDKPVYQVELVRLPERKTPSNLEKMPTKVSENPKPGGALKKRIQAAIPKAPPPVKIARKKKKQAPEPVKRVESPKKKRKHKKPLDEQAPPTPDKVLASALAEIKQQATPEKAEEPVTTDHLAQALLDVRQSLKERGLEGSGLVQASQTEAIYGEIVKARIKENWRFPGIDDTSGLQAEVELEINPNGAITKTTILSSSGRPDFDRSVKKAIAETGTLPELKTLRLKTIVITFHSGEL